MNYPIRIWSSAYAPSPETDPFSIQVERHVWQDVMRHEGARRRFLRIQHPDGLEDWIAPLGNPVSVDHDEEEAKEERIYNIYMPLWMIDAGGFKGEGEETHVEIVNEEYFPEATRIVFRVVDSAFYNADAKEELERALSAIGVIRQHTTLQIPIAALGGYAVEVFVSQTEPASLVLCDGEEVAVEFEEPVDQIAPPPPIPEPILPEPMVSVPIESNFPGQGMKLGSSSEGPEWRRGLRPPPRR